MGKHNKKIDVKRQFEELLAECAKREKCNARTVLAYMAALKVAIEDGKEEIPADVFADLNDQERRTVLATCLLYMASQIAPR